MHLKPVAGTTGAEPRLTERTASSFVDAEEGASTPKFLEPVAQLVSPLAEQDRLRPGSLAAVRAAQEKYLAEWCLGVSAYSGYGRVTAGAGTYSQPVTRPDSRARAAWDRLV
jgi:hypothetical protein